MMMLTRVVLIARSLFNFLGSQSISPLVEVVLVVVVVEIRIVVATATTTMIHSTNIVLQAASVVDAGTRMTTIRMKTTTRTTNDIINMHSGKKAFDKATVAVEIYAASSWRVCLCVPLHRFTRESSLDALMSLCHQAERLVSGVITPCSVKRNQRNRQCFHCPILNFLFLKNSLLNCAYLWARSLGYVWYSRHDYW
jgi:hypothetical protein